MAEPLFLPPEAFQSGASLSDDDVMLELSSATPWDVAVRYHELKSKPGLKNRAQQLRKVSAHAILERAQEVLGSVVRPMDPRVAPWSELPTEAEQPDIDLDETIENSTLAIAAIQGRSEVGSYSEVLTADDVWMEFNVHRKQSVVLAVDTSLSMTGEKLALTAVALAVVVLQFPDDPIGIVAFENEAQVLKRPDERISLQELVERFIDVPAQGYTHLEAGMIAALLQVRGASMSGQSRPPSTVLVTDGKYTAGRDPAYLAPRFPYLTVLKMGYERSSLELCRELARKGRGAIREVGELEELPQAMYGVVKDLLRGVRGSR